MPTTKAVGPTTAHYSRTQAHRLGALVVPSSALIVHTEASAKCKIPVTHYNGGDVSPIIPPAKSQA